MAEVLEVSGRTEFRAKRRYAEERLGELRRHHNSPKPYRKVEAHPVLDTGQSLIALVCSPASDGHDQWTLGAMAGTTVELGLVESLSHGRCGCT